MIYTQNPRANLDFRFGKLFQNLSLSLSLYIYEGNIYLCVTITFRPRLQVTPNLGVKELLDMISYLLMDILPDLIYMVRTKYNPKSSNLGVKLDHENRKVLRENYKRFSSICRATGPKMDVYYKYWKEI